MPRLPLWQKPCRACSGQCCVAAQEAAALAEAQASNQCLRTQLVEATSAFHHALSIAQTLLNEGAFRVAFWHDDMMRALKRVACMWHNILHDCLIEP